MITISNAVKNAIYENPFFYESISQGLSNFSQIAKLIHKDIEQVVQKQVKIQSIIVSLSRLSKSLKSKSFVKTIKANLNDVSIKTPISEFILEKNPENIQKIAKLNKLKEKLLGIIIGETEINIVCSQSYARTIRESLKIKRELPNLAIITVHFNEKLVHIPGLLYYITGLLFTNNINIVEIISTYTELNILIEPKNLQKTANLLLNQLNKTA